MFGARLARGSSSSVYKAFDRDSGRIFAAKVCRVNEPGWDHSQKSRRLVERLGLLEDLRHPHLLWHLGHELLGCNLHIYLEYVPEGSLRAVLQEFGAFAEPVLSKATRGLLEGLHHLHTLTPHMAHGDINSSSIFVSDGWRLKVQCFQFTRESDSEVQVVALESIPWMAPEVVQGRQCDLRQADLWGAGCAVLAMATGDSPWAGARLDEVLGALHGTGGSVIPPLPAALPEGPAQRCLRRCLQSQPEARPSAGELLQGEFGLQSAGQPGSESGAGPFAQYLKQ